MLTVKDLTISVGNKTIVKKFSYSFEKGKTYAIMGPNGSGKSTLAYAIMGHPSYILSSESKISFYNKRIETLTSDKRAKEGIFLSFQTPLSLSGIKIFQLLRHSLSGKVDPLEIQNKVNEYAKKLKIDKELLNRSLNEGASGGEKKKLEVLQEAVLNPKCSIFDEIDTGVDVDALKTISKFLELNKKEKTYIIITHYNRILKYIKPDKVLVLMNGELVKEGDYHLAQIIENNGYERFS